MNAGPLSRPVVELVAQRNPFVLTEWKLGFQCATQAAALQALGKPVRRFYLRAAHCFYGLSPPKYTRHDTQF